MAPLAVQAKSRDGSTPGSDDAQGALAPPAAGGEPSGDAARAPESAHGSLGPPRPFVVDDEGVSVDRSFQLRRSQFLARVRQAVCETANEGFSGTGRTADDCPWIEYWLEYYGSRDAAYLSRSLRDLAPETARAATAEDAIALVAARVRRSVDHYVRTGEITGVPDGFTPEIPGMRLLGGLFGGLLFKRRPGGARAPLHAPEAVMARLGAGRPLAAGVRSRMDAIFGVSFSYVRVHTDGDAARLSSELKARAFAVGEHVAFGPAEYCPGTPVGDALIAHELAHTIQQAGAGAVDRSAEAPSLEDEADRAAAGAVGALWGTGSRRRTAAAAPASRTGLRLSRCSPRASTPAAKTTPGQQAREQAKAQPEEKPPDPESSYWWEDPKKQQRLEGDQEIDFGKRTKGGDKGGITTTLETRRQVVVDKPGQYSRVGSVYVRFAYSLSNFSEGKESVELRKAKAALLQALKGVIEDTGRYDIGDVTWENKEEEKQVRARKKRMDEDRARMLELFKGFTQDKPLNVYLAPQTEQEFRSGNYVPTTAQVWVSMDDVGDPAKLKTALRIPLHHILGGPNPAKGAGVEPPADLRRTLAHESVHALLLNRSADSGVVWKQAQSRIQLTGPDDAQKRAMAVLRAYVLAQEELFAYNLEETLYAPASGSMQSGKADYERFMSAVDLFLNKKKVGFDQKSFKIDVEERVQKKKVPWEIVYRYPKEVALTEADKSVLDLAISIWPLK